VFPETLFPLDFFYGLPLSERFTAGSEPDSLLQALQLHFGYFSDAFRQVRTVSPLPAHVDTLGLCDPVPALALQQVRTFTQHMKSEG
jgi:hypothetical protein